MKSAGGGAGSGGGGGEDPAAPGKKKKARQKTPAPPPQEEEAGHADPEEDRKVEFERANGPGQGRNAGRHRGDARLERRPRTLLLVDERVDVRGRVDGENLPDL